MSNIDLTKLKKASDIEAEKELDRKRNMKVSRRDFCINLKRANILSASDAISAAKGEWPSALITALSSLTVDEADEAKIEWAAAQEIHRTHPMIILLQDYIGLTDAQVDSLFE